MYESLKTIHIIGVIILTGNVTITAYGKLLADLTQDPKIIAHAQRSVTIADWIFTLSGIVLTVLGGFGAALLAEMPLLEPGWLATGEILFAISGLIWLLFLVPLQIRQARDAREFALSGTIPARYWRDARLWLTIGIIATVPLVAAIYVMIAK